ncbi:hypothetical protein EIN_359170 [Entamoeba invadens IP1]|uniref:Uncharacterized protein n=1 Tax=Entamoeba invadens IP1 TaxID=370355 RepID=A0A0A1UDL5_ENTIV|nr:hypothetical protein EIN_359170 [Entamoeba invadens IP1]ELP90834.1 hypothetical protein EIN_359170 [Entamoeba invadens IP1]|eukprot:XP_004257605.1 hypothetical protein EIN_359170 [Entamoeba invadens IP1]
MFAFLALLVIAHGQSYTCTDAPLKNLPRFTTNVTFGTSIPVSQVQYAVNSVPIDVHAIYFRFKDPSEVATAYNVLLSTCSLHTTVEVDIDIYSTCTNGVATMRLAYSGVDGDCEAKKLSLAVLNINVNNGVEYIAAFKLRNITQSGNVELNVMQNYKEHKNIECDTAINVDTTNLPFVETGYLTQTSTNAIQPGCLDSSKTSLWYKLKGDGYMYVANTCNYYTNFDSRIVVVKGSSLVNGKCNKAVCFKEGKIGCGNLMTSSVIAFQTEAGTDYFIGIYSAGGNGQYLINVNKFMDSVPATCLHALPVSKLPFSHKVSIPDAWPLTKAACGKFTQEYRSIYLSFAGNNKTMVFSTCKSLTPELQAIGVGVELVNNCADEKCAVADGENGECYENNYIIKKTEIGTTYFIKVFCREKACDMTLNIYEKTQDHFKCEDALVLQGITSYDDVGVLANIEKSIHGCDSIAEQSKGLWYKVIHDQSKVDEEYTILAMNGVGSKIGMIEFSDECNVVRCSGKSQGQATLSFSSESTYQYVFAYAYSSFQYEMIAVKFITNMVKTYAKCSEALEVTLPFTALHSFANTKSYQTCLSNGQSTLSPANYYKFTLDKDCVLDASTCFPKTLVNTAIEISTKCHGDVGNECVGIINDSKGCPVDSASISIDGKKGTYILSVFSESTAIINTKQYRLVIFVAEVPQNSMCDKPTEINVKNYYNHYLLLNRQSQTTDLGTGGITRGIYFRIQTNEEWTIQVKTCSMSTTMNSIILLHDRCTTQVKDGVTVSYPDDLVAVSMSSIKNCDIHGTYLTFNTTTDGKEHYIFVAPQNNDETGFIDVEFYMDPIEAPVPDQSSSHHNDDDNKKPPVGWIVFGVIVFVVFVVVIAGILVVIFLKTKKAGYSTFE